MHGLMRHRFTVYIIAAVCSVLLSLWASIKTVVINPDAICYLQSAQSMSQGLHAAMHLCDQAHWPFYSAIIYAVNRLSHLSYLQSAYLINGFFSLITVLTFITIVRFLKGSTRVLAFAAVVILLAHEFNATREYIVRDHGFWAFYLLSLLFFLRFIHKPRWCYALSWSMSLIIAALFRVEGFIFLLALPFTVFFANEKPLQKWLQLNAMTVCGLIVAVMYLALHPSADTGRMMEIQLQLTHGLTLVYQNFQATAVALQHSVLNRYSAHETTLILCLLLLSWYVVNVIENLSIIYSVFVVFAWSKKLLPLQRSASLVLWAYILVNVIITAGFLVEHMFLSKRYLVALSLTFMLWVPFALEYVYVKSKALFAVGVVLIIAASIGGIFSMGFSKQYVRDAGEWLEKNTPSTASVYSNDYQVMYYSQRFGNDIFAKQHAFAQPNALAGSHWQQYNYIALRFKKDEVANATVATKDFGTPVQVFANKRGDEVVIYKVH